MRAELYEPYIIANKDRLPRYDERFRGYGMNKVSHLYATASAGAAFVVQPRHFVAAHEHDKSTSWQQIFGTDADPRQKMRVAAIYRRLKSELPVPSSLTVGSSTPKQPPSDKAALAPVLRKQGELPAGVKFKRPDEECDAWIAKRARCATAQPPVAIRTISCHV